MVALIHWPTGGSAGAVLPAGGPRDRGVRGRAQRAPAGAAEGPHRLRQDTFRGAHGLAPEAAAGDRGLPRGPERQRPGRPLAARRTGHALAWTARWPRPRATARLCYLDELMEARADTTVLLHPLADTRRVLPLERHGELLHAHPDFQLVVSYNPGYQGLHQELKPSTRQRFVALGFDYPDPPVEAGIVAARGPGRARAGRAAGAARRPHPAPARRGSGGRRLHPHAGARRAAGARRSLAAWRPPCRPSPSR